MNRRDRRQGPAYEKFARTGDLQGNALKGPPAAVTNKSAHTRNDADQISVRKRHESKWCTQSGARLEGVY